MWNSKLRVPLLSVPRRYLDYKFYGESPKSSVSQGQNIPVFKEILSEKVTTDLNIPTGSGILKTNPYLIKKHPSRAVNINKYASVSFDDIPGPTSLRLMSKFWGLIPTVGTEITVSIVQYLLTGGKFYGNFLSWGGNAPFFKKLFDAYGPVVKLHGAFGSDVVLLSRPEHATAIFQNEERYEIRSCLDSVEKYRLEYRSYRQVGPFLMIGSEWEKIRKSLDQQFQTTLMRQYDKIENVCNDFIRRIINIRNKQEEMPSNFRLEISKWSLECLAFSLFNSKLGFLDSSSISPTSDAGRLLEGVTGATEAVRKCEYGFHLWKFLETPAWKSLVKNCEMIDSVFSKHIERAVNALNERKQKNISVDHMPLLEVLLLKDGIVEEDVMTVLLDMFLIGSNAITHTVSFLFFHLARNPRCQIKLHEEINKFGGIINNNTLKKMSFLHACIKECLRLNPPMPILSRILSNDITIHHYHIPKGTHILFATYLNTLREEYFEDSHKFKPERWLNDETGGFGNEYQTFASIPFGYGAKSSIAKEIAEMQIAMLVFKVCRKFKIEYNYGDVKSSNEFLASPNMSLKFRFINRS